MYPFIFLCTLFISSLSAQESFFKINSDGPITYVSINIEQAQKQLQKEYNEKKISIIPLFKHIKPRTTEHLIQLINRDFSKLLEEIIYGPVNLFETPQSMDQQIFCSLAGQKYDLVLFETLRFLKLKEPTLYFYEDADASMDEIIRLRNAIATSRQNHNFELIVYGYFLQETDIENITYRLIKNISPKKISPNR